MIERYRLTAERIRQEIRALERVVSRAQRAMQLAKEQSSDRDLYLDAVVLNLHDFYSGVERTLQQIAERVDEAVPTGADWHQALLQQMSTEKTQIRPAVISSEVSEKLCEYLRFRHVVRNVYAFEFDFDRLHGLAQDLDLSFGEARHQLEAFACFLDRLARSDEETT